VDASPFHLLRRFPRLALLAIFAALAVVHTWPLGARPSYYSRLDTADTQLNTWAMAWVARTLPTDPLHLFDADIFYPEKRTLAYSEPLLVQGCWRFQSFGSAHHRSSHTTSCSSRASRSPDGPQASSRYG
jgi:hypothetical protein